MTDWFSEGQATFGDRLSAAREAAGLGQGEVARRLGVRTATVAAWEDDQAEPRANRLHMLSGLLGVSLMWMLTGRGDGVPAPDEAAGPDDLAAIRADLRSVRFEMVRLTDRLGVLEKRLRQAEA